MVEQLSVVAPPDEALVLLEAFSLEIELYVVGLVKRDPESRVHHLFAGFEEVLAPELAVFGHLNSEVFGDSCD